MEYTKRVISSCRLGRRPLFVVGTFDSGVTVLSQQIRSLNLVWALIETGIIECDLPDVTRRKKSVAIVGGGFAGLAAAAGLMQKDASAEITIFEERDTLLPLQQGSDSRWLHPKIYNWPEEGSEANVAMLPVLNWTAARASDVAVQLLTEWQIIAARFGSNVSLYCNARHLQIHEDPGDLSKLRIEWVGEERRARDGASLPEKHAAGASKNFDVVILAVGFGLERDGTSSYWRNETLGQPSLDQPRRTFLISGQGDGAMIDLLRLRVSQYRQDRILDELFLDKKELLSEIGRLRREYALDRPKAGLFDAFEGLSSLAAPVNKQFENVLSELRGRLRRDTEAILRLRNAKFAKLFDPNISRISFQNRFLVYLLYKCGGFFPTMLTEKKIFEQSPVDEKCVVRRHGTRRKRQLKRVLSGTLYSIVDQRLARSPSLSLPDVAKWPGGFFGFPGPESGASTLPDQLRKGWRKEYLPGPTSLLASSLCSSIAGAISRKHPSDQRLRVTFHRAVQFGKEDLLQQACDYQGIMIEARSTAARTFSATNATIGLAYRCRGVIRSKRHVDRKRLKQVMAFLNLNATSSKMSDDVSFVLAVPVLEPEGSFVSPSPVAGVLYIDSTSKDFFIDDGELGAIVSMTQYFLDSLTNAPPTAFDRIRNLQMTAIASMAPPVAIIPLKAKAALEVVRQVAPPQTSRAFQFNYDYSDFVPSRIEEEA